MMAQDALNLGHEGTRQQHLIELLELWNDTLSKLEERGWHPSFQFHHVDAAKVELKAAIKQLQFVIGASEGYNESFYRAEINCGAISLEDTPRSAQ